MLKCRVMIADDSVVFRSQIRRALEGDGQIEIVGSASTVKMALEILRQRPVDIVVVDLGMAEGSGVELLKGIQQAGYPSKIIVFSAQDEKGARSTLKALSLGATDFVSKPMVAGLGDFVPAIRASLLPKVLQLWHGASKPVTQRPLGKAANPLLKIDLESLKPEVILIGTSTGGPNALEHVFGLLSPPISVPILIVQHMPPVFTASLAERLAKASGLEVREAVHGEALAAHRVYIAPGDYHLTLARAKEGIRLNLDQTPERNSCRPSVDALFESAAPLFREKCLAFVLTGMGQDGKLGALRIKELGGAVMIQNEKSCVIFGMPGAVYAAGAFDAIGDLTKIASVIDAKARGKRP